MTAGKPTASPQALAAPAIGRERPSVLPGGLTPPRIVVEPGERPCSPRIGYLPPWQPRKGNFVSMENGWGARIRAEIVAVPSGPTLATRGALWQEET
jgi:hypothetical protein